LTKCCPRQSSKLAVYDSKISTIWKHANKCDNIILHAHDTCNDFFQILYRITKNVILKNQIVI
jgi:hypothetical protein